MSLKYYCYGIDVGRLNSYIAGYHNSKDCENPKLISLDIRRTPNIVSFNDIQCIVGRHAEEPKLHNQPNTFFDIYQ